MTNIPLKTSNPTKFWPSFFLCLFLGFLAAHRFYLKSPKRVLMLLTLGGFGIWVFIDMICILLGKFKDQEGNQISNPKPGLSWGIFVVIFFLALVSDNSPSGIGGSFGIGGSSIKQYMSDDGDEVLSISLSTDDANIVTEAGAIECKWRTENGKMVLHQPNGMIVKVLIPTESPAGGGYTTEFRDAGTGMVYTIVK